jgi:hypothetical protein
MRTDNITLLGRFSGPRGLPASIMHSLPMQMFSLCATTQMLLAATLNASKKAKTCSPALRIFS